MGVPSIAAEQLAADREAERLEADRSEMVALRERVSDLEFENERLRRKIDQAREDGRRDEREVAVRTMGGRLVSILLPGCGR